MSTHADPSMAAERQACPVAELDRAAADFRREFLLLVREMEDLRRRRSLLRAGVASSRHP